MPLIDDSRRMSAYRSELKTRGMSLADVIDAWEKIDNPPKQTRTSARKATDSPTEKRTPAKVTPEKRTLAKAAKAAKAIDRDGTIRDISDDPTDDPDMAEYLEFMKFKAMKERANKR
jgi:hypothetical protein